MDDKFVSSIDFIGNLIENDLIWFVERIFANNCHEFREYRWKIIKRMQEGRLDYTEGSCRLYNRLCECIGEYTPLTKSEFATILAPLRAEQFDSEEAFEVLLQPLENWIERMSRSSAVEVA